MTEFGHLDENGNYTHVRTIRQADIVACPHLILAAEHYRDDGSCRCDDPEHTEMARWGYTWLGGRWT